MASISEIEPREDFTSNGVAFEVIISPGRENARKPNVTPKKKENLSKEELDERMEAAKIRRNSLKGVFLAKAALHQVRIDQAKTIKQQTAEEQSRMTKEKIMQKMELHIGNKEAQIRGLIDRLHAKDQYIKEVQGKLRNIIELYTKKVEEKIQQKEAITKENLELQRQAQLERWEAREKHIKEVLATLQESIEQQSKLTEWNLQQKMEVTAEKRQSLIRSLQERLRYKSQKIEQARQIVEALIQENSKYHEEKQKQKLEQSEEKRKAYQKAKQDKLVAHQEHVEEVCKHVKTQRAAKAQG